MVSDRNPMMNLQKMMLTMKSHMVALPITWDPDRALIIIMIPIMTRGQWALITNITAAPPGQIEVRMQEAAEQKTNDPHQIAGILSLAVNQKPQTMRKLALEKVDQVYATAGRKPQNLSLHPYPARK